MNSHSTSFTVQNFAPTIPDGSEVSIPEMVEVKQSFPDDKIDDVRDSVMKELAQLSELDLKGKSIAITAGSRGISGMVETLRAIVDQLTEWGATPFLVPAMGSHGGATAEGQLAVLKNLGITEESMGAPIRSSMDVVELGQIQGDTPVCCDRLAFESDGIIVCNRIKAHTSFVGEHESGLAKMMVIGLGKHVGTNGIHRLGFKRFSEVIPEAAALILNKAPILCGVGLVENAYNQVARVEVIPPESIFERERELLKYAKSIMGRILVPEMDILVIDELGKDVSGAGMDPNVIGRSASGVTRETDPIIGTIVLRDLSKKTAGNSLGMGMADIICKRAVDKIELTSVYTNAITAGLFLGSKLPLVASSDRDAISIALRAIIGSTSSDKRIVHIPSTKSLETIWLSTAFLPEILDMNDLAVVGESKAYEFDGFGAMQWPTNRD
ncbi:MAG: lactate racemase domain-containing protein [Opitutales bacterium]|nr:lactate racemase domain-containing protein [Opitutales bacterium]